MYNRLQSIVHDADYVESVVQDLQLCQGLPVIPNLRCGVWYVREHCTPCYFKSADGHYGEWDFSTIRLNLDVVRAAAEFGGAVIVDATRSVTKRLPDSFSKTLPIWAAIVSYHCMQRLGNRNTKSPQEYLYLPPWVPCHEKALIESALPGLLHKANGVNFGELVREAQGVRAMNKPLRCIWVSRSGARVDDMDRQVWGDERAEQFVPLVCISASSNSASPHSDRRGWRYIQGGRTFSSFSSSSSPEMSKPTSVLASMC